MRKDKEGLSDIDKLILFFRAYPVQAAKELLGVDLIWFQRKQLRELWHKPYCVMKWSRGCSKTWLTALYLILRAMLYPGTKIGIVPPSYRQSGYVFDAIQEIMDGSAYMRQSIVDGKIKRTTDRMLVQFSNGSFIEGLPIGHDGSKIRGRRYHIVLMDEHSQHDDKTIDLVVVPFLAVKKGTKANQMVMASTPLDKTNHFYQTCKDYIKFSRDPIGSKKYSYSSYDFTDVLLAKVKHYQIDLDLVMKEFRKMSRDEFLMEWAGYFPSDSTLFFSMALIDSCTPRIPNPVPYEIIGQNNCTYVMGIDTAREEHGDNFAVTILKLSNNYNTNQSKSVVKVMAKRGMPFPKMNQFVREQLHLHGFNISKIFMDFGGGGRALGDLLAQSWIHDGIRYPPIVLDNNPYSPDYLSILRLIHFNETSIDYMYKLLKADMEQGKVLFPLTTRKDPDPYIQEQGQEMGLLKMEMRHLAPVQGTRGTKFEAAPGIGKDRVTSLVLANYASNASYVENIGSINTEDLMPPIGEWI